MGSPPRSLSTSKHDQPTSGCIPRTSTVSEISLVPTPSRITTAPVLPSPLAAKPAPSASSTKPSSETPDDSSNSTTPPPAPTITIRPPKTNELSAQGVTALMAFRKERTDKQVEWDRARIVAYGYLTKSINASIKSLIPDDIKSAGRPLGLLNWLEETYSRPSFYRRAELALDITGMEPYDPSSSQTVASSLVEQHNKFLDLTAAFPNHQHFFSQSLFCIILLRALGPDFDSVYYELSLRLTKPSTGFKPVAGAMLSFYVPVLSQPTTAPGLSSLNPTFPLLFNRDQTMVLAYLRLPRHARTSKSRAAAVTWAACPSLSVCRTNPC